MIGEETSAGASPIGLSFIDLVSGGFGAAFFLFLIFVTLPITVVETGGGGDQYIDLRLEWESATRLEVVVGFTPEDGTVERYLRLSDRDVRVDPASGEVTTLDAPFWQDLFVFGYAGRSESRMQPADGTVRTATLVRMIRPCAGRYRFFVNATGFAGQSFNFDEAPSPTEFSLFFRAVDDRGTVQFDPTTLLLEEFDGRSGAFRPPRTGAADENEPVPLVGFADPTDPAFEFRSRAASESLTCME